ncbi:MAG TPA: penicillin-binding protein 2 [Alphaproteobacteria bacterium]|nr:penicillin-binding protein 2 [Alphaproteobacteria bacterium]
MGIAISAKLAITLFMDRDQEKVDSFARRAFIVGGLQGLGLSMLGLRLSWLQLVEGDRYTTLAENNRINVRIIPPSRGQIVDRYGVPLATNLQNFQVLITQEQTEDTEKTLRELQSVITIDEADIEKALKLIKKTPSYVPVEVRDNLAWEDVSKIELNLPHLPGVTVQAGELRSYPYKEATAHIVGYVGRVSDADKMNDKLLSLPGFQVGKSAVEKKFDLDLRGRAGRAEMEVNVHGRPVRQLGIDPAKAGARVVLSIDAEFQRFVQQRLATERSASAVVMDVETGEIYACVSHPAFDPNAFSGGISTMDWNQLRDDPTYPLNNKAISGVYPPGSTFKIVTALAGLETGEINRGWTVNCPGHYDLGSSRFHCWKSGGHGMVNVVDALAHSCDTFFYKLANQMGIDPIAEMAKKLGVGQLFDFDLPEEKSGLMPDRKWKNEVKGEPWHPGESLNSAIGQGAVLATPLQLATMLSRVVNGGKNIKPWLAGYANEKPLSVTTEQAEDLGISKRNIDIVRRGLEAVLEQGGTAYGSRISEPGMTMGGKTGTSQVKRITMAERAKGVRRQEDLPWHLRHHALFVGYAPTENPKYACCVVVDHGIGGSAAAAPIAKDIMLEVQKRDPKSKILAKNIEGTS